MTEAPWLAMTLLGLLGCAIGIWLDQRDPRPGLDGGWADNEDEDEPDLFMTERPLTDREIETLLSATRVEVDQSDYSHLFDPRD